MRKKLFTGIIVFFSVFVYAQNTVIKGKLINNTGYSEFYLEDLLTGTVLDTIKINSRGKFKTEINFTKSDFYKFNFDENNYVIYIPEPGEKAVFEFDIENLRSPVIEGSKQTELVYSIFNETKNFDEKIAEFQEKINKQKQELIRNMIKENSQSLACLFFVEELNIDDDIETYQLLNKGLQEYSDNYLVSEFSEKVKKASVLAIGSEAPEIIVPDITGKEIKLSSFRGNYVLIDFWASWCAPCRKESPNLLKMYNKYSSKGFKIFSISLDETEDVWKEAVTEDKIGAWSHGIDMEESETDPSTKYNVSSIPFTVLVDKNGKIVAKNLRGGSLENKLKEIYGK